MEKYTGKIELVGQNDFLANFEKPEGELEAKYGLPSDVKFCKKCVISNQRPNSAVEFQHTKASNKQTINFDDDGVCDACRVAEKKVATVDWAERERELKELCDKHRKSDGSYDCLVPGSGGKDSFYQYVRNELCFLSCDRYNEYSYAGIWATDMSSSRTSSNDYVGFRCACYLL